MTRVDNLRLEMLKLMPHSWRSLLDEEKFIEIILNVLVSDYYDSEQPCSVIERFKEMVAELPEEPTKMENSIKGNGIVPTWAHDTILNAAAHKLRRLMLVRGERKGQKVRFHRVDCFENLHISLFIPEIINGTIAIEFNAREHSPGSDRLRNHGTKFRIAPDHVCRIYFHKERMA